MPYCNQCGRYIGGGMLCAWCGDTNVKKNEENCRGLDGMPTPDGANMTVGEEGETGRTDVSADPSKTGTTPSCDADEDYTSDADGMDVTEGTHVPGDVTGEVVSEGRTIVTSPEENPLSDATPENADGDGGVGKKESLGARIGARLGEWAVGLFTPKEEEASFSHREMRVGRGMAVLCYLGILWAIPYFRARSNRYVAHHLERGLNILLLATLGMTLGGVALVLGILMPFTMPLVAAVSEVVLLGAVSMSIWNIVRVCTVGRVPNGAQKTAK